MEELVEILLGFACVLTIVTLLGHGIWVALAFLFQAFSGKETRKKSEDRRREPSMPDELPWVRESRELKDSRRILEEFVAKGELDQAAIAPVLLRIDARLAVLSGQMTTPLSTLTPSGRLAELERLLGGGLGMPAEQRDRAMELALTLENQQVARLAAAYQYTLGKILEGKDRFQSALRVYRGLLNAHGNHPGCVQTALEAARLAVGKNLIEDARYFLAELLRRDPSPGIRLEAEEMLARLNAATTQPAPAPAPVASPELPTTPAPITAALVSEAPAAPIEVPAPLAPAPTFTTGPIPAPAEPVFTIRRPAELAPVEPPKVYEAARVVEPPRPIEPPQPSEPLRPVAASYSVEPPRVAPAPPPRPVAPPEPPPPPRKPFAEVLSSFMEERNIRWGELVGGLLIVGCSIALVFSLWNTLAQIPYYQFLVFSLSTAAVYGVGLYTQHRWKLASTSHGVLIIASLLVPLNFLAMALSSTGNAAIRIPLELVSLAAFAYLGSQAARILVPTGRWLMPVGMLGSSASMLLMARMIPPASEGTPGPALATVAGLGLLPLASHLAALGLMLWQSSRAPAETSRREEADGMFALLGTTAFALAVALGFLIVRAGGISQGGDWLAVHGSLAAIPIVAAGLLLMGRLKDEAELAVQRTAATTVAIAGMVAMVAATVVAWPWPWELILVGLVNYAALTVLAWRSRMSAAHALALASLTGAYLATFHALWGTFTFAGPIEWATVLEAGAIAKTGTSLVAFFVLLAIAGEGLNRLGRSEDSRYYSLFAGMVAVVSVVLVTFSGIGASGQAVRSMAVYAIYGIGAVVLNLRMQRRGISYAGFALLIGASLWGLWWKQGVLTGLWPEVLAGEALLLAGVSVGLSHWKREETAFSLPAGLTSLAVACFAGGLAAWMALDSRGTIAEPVWTGAMLAGVSLLLAWRFEDPTGVRLAGVLLFASAGYGLMGPWVGTVAYPWSFAALATATALGIPAGLLAWLARPPKQAEGEPVTAELVSPSPAAPGGLLARLNALFLIPLGETAGAASVLTLPAIFAFSGYDARQLAVVFGWLSVLWLVGSVARRVPEVFTAFQVVLAAAVIWATQAWVEVQSWYATEGGFSLSSPHAVHAFGLTLGGLALVWAFVRLGLTRAQAAQDLMKPAWPAFDRILTRGLALSVLLINALWILAAGSGELLGGYSPANAAFYATICGSIGWVVVGLVATTQIVSLFNGWRPADGVAFIAVAASAGYLLAGGYHVDVAVASALRWWLSIAFLVMGAVVWARNPMRAIAEKMGASLSGASPRPRAAEILLLVSLALPVVAITGMTVLAMIAGTRPAGPLAGTFFAGWQPLVNFPIPLVVVIVGLVGFAVRETSATYAFGGGMLASLASASGYVMQNALAGQSYGIAEFVCTIQIATLASSLWALAWLGSRAWLPTWRETGETPRASFLMSWQLGWGTLGNAILLLMGCGLLALLHPWEAVWPEAAGGPWGWGAFLAAIAAWVLRSRQAGRKLRPNVVGLLGLAGLGLVACSVQAVAPDWGCRALMLAWAFYSLAVVLATWFVATHLTDITPAAVEDLMRVAARWVRVAGFLAVMVALKLAIWHNEQLYAAAGITIAALAGATMAIWRRREGWAFVAGWGANVAATLVVWHFLLAREIPWSDWWLHFLEANTIATGGVALLWLAARRRLYAGSELTLRAGPLLGFQVALAAIGCTVFVSVAALALMMDPGQAPEWLARIGHAPGWIALGLSAVAALLYVRQVARERAIDVIAPALLAVGVMAACQMMALTHDARVAAGSTLGTWPAYHTLMIGWGAAGALLLAAGMILATKAPEWLSRTSSNAWVTVIAVAVAGLAMRGWQDPHGPYWSASHALVASLLVAVLAVWLRMPAHAWLAGLFVNVAASLIWWHYGPPPMALGRLALANVLALAGTSLAWTLAGLAWQRIADAVRPEDGTPPFAHVAAALAALVMTVLMVLALASDLQILTLNVPLWLGGTLGWTTLGLALAAVIASTFDRSAAFAPPTLYLAGLVALGLGLHQAQLAPRDLGWWGTVGLAGYVLAALVAARLAGAAGYWKPRELSANWFFGLEAVLGAAVFGLAAWVALDRGFAPTAGLAGPLAAALVFAAALLAAFGDWSHETYQRGARAAVLLGVVPFVATGGWALWPWLEPTGATPLARAVQALAVLLPAASLSLALGAFGLAWRLPPDSPWAKTNERVTPVWGALSVVVLIGVMVLEWQLLEHGVAVGWATTLSVSVGLIGLMAMAIGWALATGREGQGYSLAQRQAFVYAAEALVMVLCVHVRLTRPEFFGHGFLKRYGVFIVMGVAFAGAGLAEVFRRRKVEVLADPLWRTALVLPLFSGAGYWFLAEPSPLLWFMISLFYGFLSVQRGSLGLGMLAAASLNLGLWIIWHERGLHFAQHLQLWLIPLGISALAAEQLNHRRLSRQQSTSIRYVAMSVIYLSSTADMFVAGIDRDHLYLPLVLAGLSVLGILAGIALRIRPFLFLGSTFLMLAVTTLIWHAAVGMGQTWIWYVAGILLGAAIITLFAVFEKRRNDILLALEKFKGWE